MKKEQRKPGFFYQTMAETIELIALGSGSRGNSLAVRYGDQTLLVDAGFSCRELKRRLTVSGVDPGSVRAVLLTHEHSDHLSGCRVFCDQCGIPLYLSGRVADRLSRDGALLPSRLCEFEPGNHFDVAGFSVAPFPVQHDAVDPVGFEVRRGDFRIGIASDLGKMNAAACRHLTDCDALVLESNYDPEMLRNSERQYYLKRRISGRFGHLDNQSAAAALRELVGRRTRVVLYVHISSECNTYELAHRSGKQTLVEMGRPDVQLFVVPQQDPLPPLTIRRCDADM